MLHKKIECDLELTTLSEALYYHLWKIQLAGWRYMIDNNRPKRHPISEITQDLIAFYLNAALPENYSVELEASASVDKSKLYVDIAIKRKDAKFHFVIEVKTNIGYQRHAIKLDENGESEFWARKRDIVKGFGVKESNVIFVLFSVGNVNREFTDNYWDRNTNSAIKVKDRTSPEHLSFIFPLFRNSDPYYFKYDEKFDKKIL